MSVAVYVRVSSRSQRVRSQRREIERDLSAHDIPDARWFVDNGVSGMVIYRPALDDLKRAIIMGEVDSVIVYALDGLARNAVEGMVLLADWLARGIRLVLITMRMDFSGEVGQMVASLLLHLAQMERTRTRERQAAGIAAAKAVGKRWGGRRTTTGLKTDPGRVLELRDRGLTNGEVATALHVSTRTVARMVRRANGNGHLA